PNSVFSFAERGSKLYEPTKNCCPSTEKVLACRLEPELPKRPGREEGCGVSDSADFISYSLMFSESRSLRHLAYPACTAATSVAAREFVNILTETPLRAIETSASVPVSVGTK